MANEITLTGMQMSKTKIDEMPSAEMVLTTPPKEHSIKSNAVVKYSTVSSPVLYSQLRFNTDIKLPPRNWLTSSAASRGLNDPNFRSSGFTSFRMANMFPESVGEVDVVSDAENIKKLLKIPYSSKSVSMVVHRVENTLLIDEFDIHKHLLLRAEGDWAWMRQYFVEHILSTLSSKDRALPYHDKSRTTLQQKSLVSKFLHYSLAETDDKTEKRSEERLKRVKSPLPLDTKGPALPDPQLEHGIPGAGEDHQFTRNVLWTFENIQMLLGTDMPIFGGALRPCISLRLRDANRPISVLTGIDYWLDNLMSNVPEVVMCYHLDGIVQKYELIKTEDLPNLNESRFSPELIRDVAQNILSFLKANATKAGHTYWLFKGTNEDAVKLYDLTSLCSESMRDKEQNPFTVPVGMLLYRVARNMMATEAIPGQNNTIRTVLKNCVSLLSKEKHPQIVTSAHYMLAEVYIPFETDPLSPILLSQLEHELSSIDENEDLNQTDSAPVTTLLLKKPVASRKPQSEKYDQSSLAKCGIEERCKCALMHICKGLDCLQYFESSRNTEEEKNQPKMANPNEAIPMRFDKPPEKGRKKNRKDVEKVESKSKEDALLKTLLCKPHAKAMPTWQRREEMEHNTWKGYLLSLLSEKACLVYSILVEREIEANKYSLALKHVKNVLRCCDQDQTVAGVILSRAGDCFFSILKSLLESGADTFHLEDEIDDYPTVILKTQSAFQSDINRLDCGTTVDELAETIINCYKRALELYPSNEISRRTGNVCNVMSSLYTTKAKELLESEDFDKTAFITYITKSEQLLAFGVKIFEEDGDSINSALLLSNWGRLYRLRAHAPPNAKSILTPSAKLHYSKAFDYYSNALFSLGNRKIAPAVWDNIYWELSTCLYTWATLNQNHPPLPSGNKGPEEIEREAVELLQKAVKFCDVNTQSFRQPLYQFRLAILYQRLGSLYFNSYRTNDFDDNKAKQIVQLCHINYSKAIALFSTLDNPLQVLRVQLERLALYELVAEESKAPKSKIKNLQKALTVCSECQSAISQMNKKNKETSVDDSPNEVDKQDEDLEEERLLQAFHDRLNSSLLALIKLISTSEKNPKMVGEYKQLYLASLKMEKDSSLVSHLERITGLVPKSTDG